MARYSPNVLIGSFLVSILLYRPFFVLYHINYLLAKHVQGILGTLVFEQSEYSKVCMTMTLPRANIPLLSPFT